MNLQTFPGIAAVTLASAAFAVAGITAWCCEVPVDQVALRAVLAGAAFWVVGLVAGKVVIHSICEAISEQLNERRAKEQSAQRR